MSSHTHTACHLLRPVTLNYRTAEGEDAYYRNHSWATPLSVSRITTALAALRRTLPAIRLARPVVPSLK